MENEEWRYEKKIMWLELKLWVKVQGPWLLGVAKVQMCNSKFVVSFKKIENNSS